MYRIRKPLDGKKRRFRGFVLIDCYCACNTYAIRKAVKTVTKAALLRTSDFNPVTRRAKRIKNESSVCASDLHLG